MVKTMITYMLFREEEKAFHQQLSSLIDVMYAASSFYVT